MKGMSDLLQRSLGPSILLETRFPLVMRPILADANQLEMALLNLCVNARDAMPEGGEIIVAAREVDVAERPDEGLAPGHYICLSVTDRGHGMDAQTLARATEPFFSTKGVGKGTGLGLSMVQGLAEQSGGQFRLNSRLGQGTVAELWLPAGEAMQPPKDEVEPKVDAFIAPARLRIIAVDDDFLILTNTVAMIEELGHTAFPASSARQALDILRREPDVDLVITDQAMPKMTGLQLAEAVSSEWPDIQVILATGYAEIEPGSGKGVGRLSKPFTQAQLARELSRVHRRQGGHPRSDHRR
jgi:CheY-like chemotaxis protein